MKLFEDFQHKSECYFHQSDFISMVRVIISDGGTANILYRWAQFFGAIKLGIMGWVLLEINRIFNGCVIGRGAQFDEGLVFMHPVGVVINSAVVGGKNIVIESGVVIGAARNGLPVESPQLGNNIFIGAGAKILGNIKIGNNVKIGANAVVIKDVEDNTTVAGIPARVIKGKEK